LTEATERIQKGIEEYTREGSGWAVDKVVELYININITRYQPFRRGSYIDLTVAIKSSKAVINVQNNDEHCLRWWGSILAIPADTLQTITPTGLQNTGTIGTH
jgi:L-rhamnose mutarotase